MLPIGNYSSVRERDREQYVVPPPQERAKIFAKAGQPKQIIPINLPDSQKREFLVWALQTKLTAGPDLKTGQATVKKLHLLQNGRKEGKALEVQLHQLFPAAREK